TGRGFPPQRKCQALSLGPMHSALFYLTPEDFLMGKVEERLKAREQKLRQAKWKRMEVNHVA
ncbi:MAG: hypothetical protein NUV70_08890, partial [Caldiserica bacterium]|nr:hypothetical protein [Caldisericota bacterium]